MERWDGGQGCARRGYLLLRDVFSIAGPAWTCRCGTQALRVQRWSRKQHCSPHDIAEHVTSVCPFQKACFSEAEKFDQQMGEIRKIATQSSHPRRFIFEIADGKIGSHPKGE